MDDQAFNICGTPGDDCEYEEITSEEVDRVVSELETLIGTVSSENIRCYLEDAMNAIYFLLYEEDDNGELGLEAEAA